MGTMPRNQALDALKLLLAVLVTLFHAQAFADVSRLFAQLVNHGFGRIVVPVFLLINGYFFQPVLARGDPHRWLARLALLYAACTLLYAPLWLVALPAWPAGGAMLLVRLLLGYGHLWYLAALLLAAGLLVALRGWPRRRLAALAAALFVLGMGLQLVAILGLVQGPPWLERLGRSVHLYRNGLLLAFPFFCAGCLLRAQRVPERLPGRWLAPMWVVGTLGLLTEALAWLHFAPPGSNFDAPLFSVVAAPAVFLTALRMRLGLPEWPLSTLAIGIYLLHPLGIALLWQVPGLSGLEVGVGALLFGAALTLAGRAALRAWRQRAYCSDSIRSM